MRHGYPFRYNFLAMFLYAFSLLNLFGYKNRRSWFLSLFLKNIFCVLVYGGNIYNTNVADIEYIHPR